MIDLIEGFSIGETMFIKHPNEDKIINLLAYAEIRPCSVNKTHIDLYVDALKPGVDRGKPEVIFVYKDEAERDFRFKELCRTVGIFGNN